VEQLLTDSRRLVYPETTLFFALPGSRRDGHDFIPELYARGLRQFVVSIDIDPGAFPQANIIRVEDSLKALQELAGFHRQQFDIPLVGITGSNGKTVVKEWLNQLLEDRFRIVRSPRSYNSQIGVPLSLWQIQPVHQLALIEAGISKTGEMQTLEPMIRPSLGILTSIGEAHDQGFPDRKTKILEKLRLFVRADALIYSDDLPEHSAVIKNWHKKNAAVRMISIGREAGASLQIKSAEKSKGQTRLSLQTETDTVSLLLGFEDDASIQNTLTCLATLFYLQIPQEEWQDRLNRLSPLAMRMELKSGIHHCSVINDSYSADISSLRLALDFLFQQKQHPRRTLILSDILETGKTPEELRKAFQELIERYPVDRFIGVGTQWPAAGEGLIKSGVRDIRFFDRTEDLLEAMPGLDFRDETILLKGARIFGFERIDKGLSLQVHETQLEVNLEAMAHNLRQYQQLLRPRTRIMAMVKAFSYGAGGYEIARLLEFLKVDYLAVAYADEGVSLRRAGIRLPILVMNTEENALMPLLEWQLEPVIFSFSGLDALKRILKQEAVSGFPVHIELETGMNRLGFSASQIPRLVENLKEDVFRVQSVFSHLAASEEAQQDEFTLGQLALYLQMTDEIGLGLGYGFFRHLSNSAGATRHPEMQLDMVRLGIGLYGVDPSASKLLELQEVGTLKTTIAQIKQLDAGETIGYNRRGIASQPMKTGTLRLGYADGYPRSLGNGVGKVWYKGRLAPTVGSLSMDMTIIDITDFKDAKEGDEVIVFGRELSVSLVAEWADTIPYDILAGISQRVKRVYFE